ncbi:protocatechuate 3,4-dioxygenase beta subunit [Tropicimonas isoalkanivorans]|uniref:Protocatechuate 3,4-dioxygenase beta subunit n=1 Tax=Tropicimonas isoalkanivorans TaxID=441112 RepID=A0A1I1PYJ9_9RHOB|nr:protocatechuate 3,4-dioxygenase beta subunit [Tropicimonas isoalkanivorans]
MSGTRVDRGRRRLALGAPALLLGATVSGPVSALTTTPKQSEGPFYPRNIPSDSDADLTVFNNKRAPGEVIEMVGRLFTTKGQLLPGGRIEIWHCDVNGVYAHVGRNTPPGFQGFGAVRTDSSGAYRFRTTLPGIYPGRTRHIHVKVRGANGAALTTQMYFPGEPGNERDGLLRRARNPAALIARNEPGPPPRYVFDIVLG